MPEVRVVIELFRTDQIILDQAELAVRGPGGAEAGGLAAVVVDAVVPAVHQVSGEGKLRVERVLGAGAEMKVRNGQREQHAARVVPVVLGLDHFRAGRSHELADVDLQALADGRQILQISFLEILIEV